MTLVYCSRNNWVSISHFDANSTTMFDAICLGCVASCCISRLRNSAIYCLGFSWYCTNKMEKILGKYPTYRPEELSWTVYIISINPRAPFTTKYVCYVISRNGWEAFWSNHFYPDQTAPLGTYWSGKTLFAFILTLKNNIRNKQIYAAEWADHLSRQHVSFFKKSLYGLRPRLFSLVAKLTICHSVWPASSLSACGKFGYIYRNRDSSPTGQFTDTHFEDSSPTDLKTVHRQNWRQFIDKFYIVFIWNVTIFTIYWCFNERMPNIKLIKLPICYCNMILFDMHTTAYIAIITLSVRKYVLYH